MGLALNEYFLVSMFVLTIVMVLVMNITKHYIEIQERELRKNYEVIDEAKDTKKER